MLERLVSFAHTTEEDGMILGSGLTPAEQAAFDVLIRFFDGETHAERKALILCSPFAAVAARHIGTLRESTVAELVMETLVACVDHPEIEYCWGERRDTRRDKTQCDAARRCGSQ